MHYGATMTAGGCKAATLVSGGRICIKQYASVAAAREMHVTIYSI